MCGRNKRRNLDRFDLLTRLVLLTAWRRWIDDTYLAIPISPGLERRTRKIPLSVCRRLSSANPRQTIFVSYTSVYDSLTLTMVQCPLTFLEYVSIVLFEGHSLSLCLLPFLSSGKTNFSGSKLETADATEHSLYLSALKERSFFLDCISICWWFVCYDN